MKKKKFLIGPPAVRDNRLVKSFHTQEGGEVDREAGSRRQTSLSTVRPLRNLLQWPRTPRGGWPGLDVVTTTAARRSNRPVTGYCKQYPLRGVRT